MTGRWSPRKAKQDEPEHEQPGRSASWPRWKPAGPEPAPRAGRAAARPARGRSPTTSLAIMPASGPAPVSTPRGRRPARLTGDDREAAILATAERLLGERPLAEISVDDLARGAGISRPAFYFYFRSKDAVVLSLLDRVVAEADAASAAAFAAVSATRPLDPRDRWRSMIDAYHAHLPRAPFGDAVRGRRCGSPTPRPASY